MLSISTLGLSFIAGLLSLLSPCVLPIIPILLASAISTHKCGPYALAAGLTLSFTLIGVTLASFGTILGLEQEAFRKFTAILLVLFGVVLMSSYLQARFAIWSTSVGATGQDLLNKISTDSLLGQFVIGLFLGIVWSPCVGPTLGAAITLASQGQELSQLGLVMFFFGLGAGLPLVVLGKLSQASLLKVRNRLFKAGKLGKQIFGALLLISGLLILTGTDKIVEAAILNSAPSWLIALTTSI